MHAGEKDSNWRPSICQPQHTTKEKEKLCLAGIEPVPFVSQLLSTLHHRHIATIEFVTITLMYDDGMQTFRHQTPQS